MTRQENMPSTLMAHEACESNLRSTVRSNARKIVWQSGLRSCILPGLPTYLGQELNVGTVDLLHSGEMGSHFVSLRSQPLMRAVVVLARA